MQKVKGWCEPKTYNSIDEFVVRQLPEKPLDYQVRFPKRFWDALEELYGLRQGHQGCAPFINAYIYDYFPKEIRQRLDEINPLNEASKRTNKQHQHFDDKLLEALIHQIERVITALQMSPSKVEFKANMARLKTYKITFDNTLILEGSEDA